MSKFRTVIPVDTKAILAKLPHGSYLHEIKMTPDKDGVEVIWDNDLIVARFQQIDFPPECFDGDLPKDVVKVIGQGKAEKLKPETLKAETVKPETVEAAGVGNNPVAPEGEKPKRKRG